MIKIKFPKQFPVELCGAVNIYLKEYENCNQEINLMKRLVEDARMSEVYKKLLNKNKSQTFPKCNLVIPHLNPIVIYLGHCIRIVNEANNINPISIKEYRQILGDISNAASKLADSIKKLKKTGVRKPDWFKDLIGLIFQSSRKNKVFAPVFAGLMLEAVDSESLVRFHDIGIQTPFAKKYNFTSAKNSKDIIKGFNFEDGCPNIEEVLTELGLLAQKEITSKKNPKYTIVGVEPSRKIKNYKHLYFAKQIAWFTKRLFNNSWYEVIAIITNIVFDLEEKNCYTGNKILRLLKPQIKKCHKK